MSSSCSCSLCFPRTSRSCISSGSLNIYHKTLGRAYAPSFGTPCPARLACRPIYSRLLRCTLPSHMQVCICMRRHMVAESRHMYPQALDIFWRAHDTICTRLHSNAQTYSSFRASLQNMNMDAILGVGPGAYEIKSGIGTRPSTRIPEGSKISIIQEIAKRRAFTPGPGHYMSFRDPTPDMLVGRKKLAFLKTVADGNRKRAATGVYVCSVPWSLSVHPLCVKVQMSFPPPFPLSAKGGGNEEVFQASECFHC